MAGLLLAVIYLSFISLGLPDSLLGSAWPIAYQELGVSVSMSGLIYVLISMSTVVSSLASTRLINRFGAGKVTAVSVATTACSMLGFSLSHKFIYLCLWAVPYGLGAGSIDAAINNFAALKLSNRHMNWLHCMWGIGAGVGPYVMSAAISYGNLWNLGYGITGLLQVVISILIFISLPLWKTDTTSDSAEEIKTETLTIRETLKIPGVKAVMLSFFTYCAAEQTVILWASSYLSIERNFTDTDAARYASLFYIGIILGRALSGFVSSKISDRKMIIYGTVISVFGISLLFVTYGNIFALAGLVIAGLGCGPVFPSIMHMNPKLFGEKESQSVVSLELASTYLSTALMPALFGTIGENISFALFPLYILIFLIVLLIAFRSLCSSAKSKE